MAISVSESLSHTCISGHSCGAFTKPHNIFRILASKRTGGPTLTEQTRRVHPIRSPSKRALDTTSKLTCTAVYAIPGPFNKFSVSLTSVSSFPWTQTTWSFDSWLACLQIFRCLSFIFICPTTRCPHYSPHKTPHSQLDPLAGLSIIFPPLLLALLVALGLYLPCISSANWFYRILHEDKHAGALTTLDATRHAQIIFDQNSSGWERSWGWR